MAQRAKGQDSTLVVMGPEGVEEAFIAIQSLEYEAQMEVLTEGYLGETTNRKDDIFNGYRGKIEIHTENQEHLNFLTRIKDRAQRRTPADGQFNIMTTVEYPNGERPRVLLEDVFFGSQQIKVGARSEYVQYSMDFECSEGRVIT